ncbi:MAG: hypothetical protein EP336_01975 [Rhodobacteraceae bacterium]|nr:MAG: hypothetical protein EP336_01975 [Paracoccaceae bacterium]
MNPEFLPDCSNCAALCCLALAFDAGDMFAHDKPAGLPCHNLDGFSCSIHADLADRGYRGCVAFDCLGAGQRVTALFSEDWQKRPKLTAPMMEAFRQMRAVQSLHQMLLTAGALPLPDDTRAELRDRIADLEVAKTGLAALARFDPAEAKRWLKSLAPLLRPAG